MSMRKTMLLATALTLFVPLGVFARSRNEHSVVIPENVQVGSTQLKAGTYKVEWKEDGSSLHVSFLDHGKTVAATEGKMVQRPSPSPYDDVVIGAAGKTQKLEEINFRGQKETLVINSGHTSAN